MLPRLGGEEDGYDVFSGRNVFLVLFSLVFFDVGPWVEFCPSFGHVPVPHCFEILDVVVGRLSGHFGLNIAIVFAGDFNSDRVKGEIDWLIQDGRDHPFCKVRVVMVFLGDSLPLHPGAIVKILLGSCGIHQSF